MRTIIINILFSLQCMIVSGALFHHSAAAQSIPAIEKLTLFADRSYYIVGEQLLFSVIKATSGSDLDSLSKTVMVEIVSPDGIQRASGKYLFEGSMSTAALRIPDELLTGRYYIRAYTKYMRNVGPEAYAYFPIWIVNPTSNDIQAAEENESSTQTTAGIDTSMQYFDIVTDKFRYNERQMASLTLNPNSATQKVEHLSISVVPLMSFEAIGLTDPIDNNPPERITYLPETRGLSISGSVMTKKTEVIDRSSIVNLSIIGSGHDFMANKTDANGRFQFSLPDYTGKRDLFLCPENNENEELKILVDNDFCSLPLNLPATLIELSAAQQSMLLSMARNKQVQEIAPVFHHMKQADKKAFTEAFYGKPIQIIQLDEYVELPSLEEYFNELPTLVKVRRKQGKKYFKVQDKDSETLVFDPLVLVDWVAIDKPEKILALSPKNIDRIEVVNEPYIKGDMLYGGIVHIISKDGYFANIDLPSTGLFIDYQFLTPISQLSAPTEAHLPDARNTLYWNPSVEVSEKPVTFRFQTADSPGKYQVVLQGITKDRKRFVQTITFEVK